MKKPNNAGFSLVELIVTILIMSILTAGTVIAVAAMHRADSDKEANKIATVLAKGRMQVLSLTETIDINVKLYADSNGQYISIMQGGVETSKTELDDEVVIAYKPENGVETTLTSGGGVSFYFSKSSGAFKSPFVEYIKVTADKDLYVCLVEDTGRCYIDTTY